VSSIAENLALVRARIANAAAECGRVPGEIRLVAVSKTKPAQDVRAAYAAGQRDFGENYAQELAKKAAELADLSELSLHFIGHLQRNKVKLVLPHVSMIHTVDSPRLARELATRATQSVKVLVEVNVGGETQKTGCPPSQLAELLDVIDGFEALDLRGLMTVPPHTEDPNGATPYFEQLAHLRQQAGGAARLPELSMGMTHDLEQAVRAGATIVRVGTAIFGARS
jgi:hypothetical protein